MYKMDGKWLFMSLVCVFLVLFVVIKMNLHDRLSCNAIQQPIEEILLENAYDNKIMYCSIAKKSLKGDKDALVNLLKLNQFDNGVAYNHGAVLLEVMSKVDINMLKDAYFQLLPNERKTLVNYLNVGYEFQNKLLESSGYRKNYPFIR